MDALHLDGRPQSMQPRQRFGVERQVIIGRPVPSDATATEMARSMLPRRPTDAQLIPANFPNTGLEGNNEDNNPGGWARLLDSSTPGAGADDPRDRSRSPYAARPTDDDDDSVAVEVGTAGDGEMAVGTPDGHRMDETSPTVEWHFERDDGNFTVTLPQWLAHLCSGRCVVCGRGSLWYMYQGWGVMAVDIHVRHRDFKIDCNAWCKMCGWCRRQVRRDIRDLYPDLWNETEQTGHTNRFDVAARQVEIVRVAAGFAHHFPDMLWEVRRIWVQQSNRTIDYWQLDRFNHA